MGGSVWVAELYVSVRTRQKIIRRHEISEDEVRDAVVCVPGLDYTSHIHAERGFRVIVRTRIRGRPALIVLYPAESIFGDSWHLGSAYFISD